MNRLQEEGIRGADLVFACIGPALEIYSRYSKVETAEGQDMTLDAYLQKVWEAVGKVALQQILGTDSPNVYGEDVRLTALFLWALRASSGSTASKKNCATSNTEENPEEEDLEDEGEPRKKTRGGFSLPFDLVRRFCQPLGIHIDRWEGHLVEVHKGVVTLLPIEARAKWLLGEETSKDIKRFGTPLTDKAEQRSLFDELDPEPEAEDRNLRQAEARRRYEKATWSHLHQDTIPLLDHVHKAMLFQKQGQTNALRELLYFEKSYRPEFVRLANALSALYPTGSDEKRLLDAMLLAVPR
jgi:putative DNA methylase